MGDTRKAYTIFVGNTEGKRQLGRPRRIWEDNIRMDLKEIWWEGVTGYMWFRIGTSGGLL
jgi:hypothetical protein